MLTQTQTESPFTELFTAVPDARLAKTLSIEYRSQLKKTLGVYLAAVAPKLGANLDEIATFSRALDPCRRFEPGVYQAFFALRKALKKSDVAGVFDGLQLLK